MGTSSRFCGFAALVLSLLTPGCDIDGVVGPLPFGTLVVVTATTGSNLDADGFRARVSGAVEVDRELGPNDSFTWTVIDGGECVVELTGIAANCSVDVNPQTVRVQARHESRVTFNVVCR